MWELIYRGRKRPFVLYLNYLKSLFRPLFIQAARFFLKINIGNLHFKFPLCRQHKNTRWKPPNIHSNSSTSMDKIACLTQTHRYIINKKYNTKLKNFDFSTGMQIGVIYVNYKGI